ncbi:hypothetical protein PRUPE_7G066600 [Prunus persica]|uniref:Uncharacterized protein n=1 Tax=Prunus persica TaxID=3760 RepID=A0A251N7Q2_PRUPE|nr:hypothetical protein PRUPE_7G066600 [Prunus persica]
MEAHYQCGYRLGPTYLVHGNTGLHSQTQTLRKNNEEAAHTRTPTLEREAGSFLCQPNQTPSSSAIRYLLCSIDVRKYV